MNTTLQNDNRYAMSVGTVGSDRLDLLDRAYGPGTQRLLRRVGLREGMAVLDAGCGTGCVTSVLSESVGRAGRVVGIDISPEQLDCARRRALSLGLENIEYVQADICRTGLPRESFDLAYCRVTLKHLAQPERAICEMRDLLKPGGLLVCEEAVLDTSSVEPPSDAHARLQALSWALFERRGCDWQVARRLYHLVRASGFSAPQVSYHQPVFVRGPEKRFEELSFREIEGRIVAAGIATSAEVQEVAAAVHRLTVDEGVVYSLSRMTQVWARK